MQIIKKIKDRFKCGPRTFMHRIVMGTWIAHLLFIIFLAIKGSNLVASAIILNLAILLFQQMHFSHGKVMSGLDKVLQDLNRQQGQLETLSILERDGAIKKTWLKKRKADAIRELKKKLKGGNKNVD